MPRPVKKGLAYFPKDVDFYDDYKVIDLLNEYGPLGYTIYDLILAFVYHEGYYLAIPLDKLASKIIRIIGNRWIRDKDFVLQVIHYCAEIGLLDIGLLQQGVITSAGIQRRYAEVTVRNKVNKDKYWILDSPKSGESIPKSFENVTKTPVFATETSENGAETPTKKRKEKESKVNQTKEIPKEILDAWNGFVEMRLKIKKPLTGRMIDLTLAKLKELAGDDYALQRKILDRSTVNCWPDVYALRELPARSDSNFNLEDALKKATLTAGKRKDKLRY